MTTATTALHLRERTPEQIEEALAATFSREGRAQTLRLQGTYSAVLGRLTDPAQEASYRYLVLPTSPGSPWTPLLELGNRADGLDRALSAELGGCAVFALFVYGEVVSGYRFVRDGAEQDRYLSDPNEFAAMESSEATEGDGAPAVGDVETFRGAPVRFADLLPPDAPPEEFARIVLRPGWWEDHERENQDDHEASDEDLDEDLVDETDRMRCIGLALELWGASEYPFADELEDGPDKGRSPAVALAFA
ncbi:MAG TPA: hypothetical protein VH349_05240 [Ktedonobacterales bacterium]|jgi:hypothetical protein